MRVDVVWDNYRIQSMHDVGSIHRVCHDVLNLHACLLCLERQPSTIEDRSYEGYIYLYIPTASHRMPSLLDVISDEDIQP